MGIPKGNISHRNRAALWAGRTQFIFRNGNALVSECGTANRPKVIELHDKTLAHAIKIGNLLERASFAPLRNLAIAGVQQSNARRAVALPSARLTHTRIHPPAPKPHHSS